MLPHHHPSQHCRSPRGQNELKVILKEWLQLHISSGFSHLCLFVCQSCLSVCQSALSPECLTSASSVTTLQPLGPLLRLTHWGVREASSFSCSDPPRLPVCMSVFSGVCPYITLSVGRHVKYRSRRLADTVGSNWEPAAALGSFSRKPGLPGENSATGGTAPSH